MTADIATLGIRVDARQVRDADQALNQFTRTGERTERQTERVNDTMARLSRMAAAVTAALSVQRIVEYADTWANLQGRLSLVAETQRDLVQTTEALFQLAQRTRTGLAETAALYGKITTSTQALNKSDAERLRVTETINKAITVSGSAASSAAAALLQLGQAFGSNRLGGEELNSVLEQTPRLAQAIAEGMGKSVGDLKGLAEAGRLTADVVFKALESQSAKLDAEFDKMPKTVAQGVTQVENALLRYIGVTDQAGQMSAGLADKLTMLANNIGTIGAALAGLASAAALNWFARLTVAVWNKVAATSAAIAADTAAAASSVAATEAAVAQGLAAVAVAEGEAAAAVGATARAAANARATAATVALTEATIANAAATRAAAGVAGWGSRLVGLMGGPIGIVTTLLGLGATAWMMWGDKAKDGEEKAEQSLAEKHTEIVAKLDKQIEKLNERNRLMQIAPAVAKSEAVGADDQRAILAEINRISKDANLTDAARTEILRVLGAQYNEVTVKMGQAAAAQDKFNATNNADKLKDWFAKNTEYLTKSAQIAAAIAKAKKELGDAYNDSVGKAITDKFNKADADKIANAYKESVKAGKEYVQQLILEREEVGAAETQTRMLKAAREAAKVKGNSAEAQALRLSIMNEAVALDAAAVAWKKKTEAEDAAAKLQHDAFDAPTQKTWEQVRALQEEINLYGLGAAAVVRASITKVQAQLTSVELTEKETAALESQLAALQQLEILHNKKDDLDSMFETSKAQSFGDVLREAFGSAGSSLGKLTDLMGDYNDKSQAADKARAAATLKYKGDAERTAKAIGKIDEQQAKDRIGAYADMAGAAKGFFAENTTGYKLMLGAERGFRALELAMQMESLYNHLFVTTAKATGTAAGQTAETATVGAGEAARNAIKIPGVFLAFMSTLGPWGMAAAGVAIAAVLGGAFGGSSSGMPSVNMNDAEHRQKAQGAGTVLGDPTAKSESMAKSLEIMQKNSDLELTYQDSMLTALQNIALAVGGAAKGVLQTSGITSGSAFGTVAASNSSLVGASHTKDITDSGVQFAGTFGQLRSGGGMGRQYEDVYTTSDGGMFRSGWSRTDTNYKNLSAEAMKPFALIFDNMGDLLVDAGVKLGKDGAQLTDAINSMGVSFGVSLRGLTGQALTDALNAGISTAFDRVTTQLFPTIQQFQKMGEGLGETLVRVAADVQGVDSVFDSMGKSRMVTVTEQISGWFGSVGRIVTTTKELSIEAKERLVEASGGLEKFANSAKSFMDNFYTEAEQRDAMRAKLNPVLAQYGLSTDGIGAQKMFRDFVVGLDVSTAAGAQTYAMLMNLQQAFFDVTDAAASERRDLLDQLDELTMTQDQLRAKERSALDATNRALYDQVQAAKAAKDAQDTLRDAMTDSVSKFGDMASNLRKFAVDLQTGSLSTLTVGEQEAAARDRYLKVAAAAQGGDVTALSQFQDVAQKFLTLSQQANGGDSKYSQDYAAVLAMTEKLAAYSDSRVDSAQAQIDALDRQTAATQALTAVLQTTVESVTAPASAAGPDNDALRQEIAALRADLAARDAAAAKLQTDAATLNRDVTLQASKNIVDAIVTRPYKLRTADETAAELDR